MVFSLSIQGTPIDTCMAAKQEAGAHQIYLFAYFAHWLNIFFVQSVVDQQAHSQDFQKWGQWWDKAHRGRVQVALPHGARKLRE